MAITAKAKQLKAQGIDIIGLGAGEPDFDTADNVKKAAIEAINSGQTKYTAVDGTPELKKAIQQKFKRENNISYELNEITVGAGAKQIIYNAIMASVNEGDEVIIPAPYWVSYPDIVELAGGKPVIVNCDQSQNFKITPSQLEQAITDKSKWLIFNSPSNPTGSCYNKQELLDIIEILKKHPNLNILSDDIYEHLVYDDFKFHTIAELAPELKNSILTLNGVSKAYSMTGWRIGFAGGSAELIKAISTIQSQSTSNPCSISQIASIEALDGDQSYLQTRLQSFQERRNYVVDELNKIEGINCLKPEGAFYVFPSSEGLVGKKTKSGDQIKDCSDLASYFLEQKVAIVPGIAFGLKNHFRISYATSMKNLEKALARIKTAIDELQ
jgi:aspartate aminotransferase